MSLHQQKCHTWYSREINSKTLLELFKQRLHGETLQKTVWTNIFTSCSLQPTKRVSIACRWPWKFGQNWQKFWRQPSAGSEAGHQLSSVCCLRSLATSTQQLVQEKREKGRSTGERIGKAGYGHGHGQRNRIFHTRRSSCAVCYCAIFGTAVLSAANSSSLDLKLVFSLLVSLN